MCSFPCQSAFGISSRRGNYLPPGVPLVKTVAAVGDDTVCRRNETISINGKVLALRQIDGSKRSVSAHLGQAARCCPMPRFFFFDPTRIPSTAGISDRLIGLCSSDARSDWVSPGRSERQRDPAKKVNWSGIGSEAAEGKIKGDGANHPESPSAHRVSPAHGSKPYVQVKEVKSLRGARENMVQAEEIGLIWPNCTHAMSCHDQKQ